jgi:hypothetical protein
MSYRHLEDAVSAFGQTSHGTYFNVSSTRRLGQSHEPPDITNCNTCPDHIALQHFLTMYGVQAIALVLRKRLRRL